MSNRGYQFGMCANVSCNSSGANSLDKGTGVYYCQDCGNRINTTRVSNGLIPSVIVRSNQLKPLATITEILKGCCN